VDASRIQARGVVKVTAIVLAVVAVAVLLALVVLHTRTTIRWAFAALFLTLALMPAVDLVERRVRVRGHGLPRWLAILAVYLLFVALMTFLVLVVIPPIVREVEALGSKAPTYIADFRSWAAGNEEFRELNAKYDLTKTLTEQASELPSRLGDAAGEVGSITVSVLTNLVGAVIVLTLTFFLLLDGRQHANRALDRMSPDVATRLRRIGVRIAAVVEGYVTVNLLLAVAAGVLTWLLLELLGVDLAVPLAVLVGFLNLMPLIGLTIGGVLVAIVAAFHSLGALIVWVVAFLAYQQLQDRVIQPVLYRNAVRLHPAIAIVAILVGAQLAGILGALLAIPTAAALGVLIEEALLYRRETAAGPAVAQPEPAD
jgi:predicted PurR-regulated permease PerM